MIAPAPGRGGYLDRRRRMLLDMHVPDWDDGFLARFDPAELVRCYQRAGVDAVMLYCTSHVGLAYWPTEIGTRHRNVTGDAVGQAVRLLHEKDIAVCGYVSVAYDNRAVQDHPGWSVQPADRSARPTVNPWPRHSVVCLNQRGYLDQQRRLLTELLGRYQFDAFFLDMAFWPSICACAACRSRYAEEESAEIPPIVDWADPAWVRFQTARERWADEFIQRLIDHARPLVDGPIYHNFAVTFGGWLAGMPLASYRNDGFVGGDLTGGRDEQLFALKLMRSVSPQLPAEYMTPRAPDLTDHVAVKPERELTLQALGAATLDSANLFIDAIDADGTVDPNLYDQIGRTNARLPRSHGRSAGTHVEDIGVYFSSDGAVDLRTNGRPLAETANDSSPYLGGVIGAVRTLQTEHLATGVATYRQLDRLNDYPVLVVPELVRISPEEVAAFRDYVNGGGSLYLSGRTSLLGTDGRQHPDFLLADLLGVRYAADEDGSELFLRPVDPAVATAIAPQRHLGWSLTAGAGHAGPPRVTATPAATVLATLSLPYGYPAMGTDADTAWASVYGQPPWTRTDHPVLVETAVGAGRVIYSVFPLERAGTPAARNLFGALVRRLLGDRATVWADAPPAVWVEAFDQPESRQFMIKLLNYPDDLDPVPVDVEVSVRLPSGEVARRWVRLELDASIMIDYGGDR